MSVRDEACALAGPVGELSESDVWLYVGRMYPGDDMELNARVRANTERKNAILFLTTFGGSPDSAYRIARCFQEVYKDGRFTVFVDTFCKSAGTLLALGASEVVMSDDAEIGPLDVQLRKPEEIGERTSGLTATQALNTLRLEAYNTFEDFFLTFRRRTQLTSKMAADVAAQITVGVFAPIYSQLEPMRLGENQRAMLVAEEYGERLSHVSRNLNRKDALKRLIADYPVHEFVIDRSEAKEFFKNLRSPNEHEASLASTLRPTCIEYVTAEEDRGPLIDLLNGSQEKPTDADSEQLDVSAVSKAGNGEAAQPPRGEAPEHVEEGNGEAAPEDTQGSHGANPGVTTAAVGGEPAPGR